MSSHQAHTDTGEGQRKSELRERVYTEQQAGQFPTALGCTKHKLPTTQWNLNGRGWKIMLEDKVFMKKDGAFSLRSTEGAAHMRGRGETEAAE